MALADLRVRARRRTPHRQGSDSKMRDLAILIMTFGSIPAIFAAPFVGVLVFTWLNYMSPHKITYSFASGLPLIEIFGLLTGILWLLSPRKLLPKPTFLFVTLACFFIWFNVTTLFALAPPEVVLWKWERTVKVFAFAVLTAVLINNRLRIEAYIWVLMLSVGYYAMLSGVNTILTGGGYGRAITPPLGSLIADDSTLTIVVLMLVPLARYLQIHATILPPVPLVRLGLLGLMALMVITVFGTHARTGLIALAVMLVMFVLKARKKALIITALILCIGAGLMLVSESWYKRMSTIETFRQDSSAMNRIHSWKYAIGVANERPIVGGGFMVFTMNYQPTAVGWLDSHSIYFEVLGEHGYVGLLIYLCLIFGCYRACRNIRRSVRGHEEFAWLGDLASMLQISLAVFATGGAFVGIASHDLFFDFCVIIIVLQSYVLRRQKPADRMPSHAAEPIPIS